MSTIGTLYVCATPIGNIEDITLRVLRILAECAIVAAEDTRRTVKLLNHYEIKTPLTSYHEHNKNTKGPMLLQRLQNGESVALVSDAGMPGISDPGEDLIKLCHENNIPVTVCPGASAGISALVLSGIEARRYVFEGFLPHDKKERNAVLRDLENETRTIVFYEAPHRLAETLKILYDRLGGRNAAAVREITKKFEQVHRGSLGELLAYFTGNEPKGEFVLVISGADAALLEQEEIENWLHMDIHKHMEIYLEQEMSEKDAMKQVAKDRGIAKREVYAMVKISE